MEEADAVASLLLLAPPLSKEAANTNATEQSCSPLAEADAIASLLELADSGNVSLY